MNVIPIVFSILMLMAIMTYAQLQNFVMRNVVRAEYVCHIANRSRDNVNTLQQDMYDNNHTPGEKREISKAADAVSKINLRIFETDHSAENQIYYEAHNEIAKRLIRILYSDRSFFREMEEKRPGVVDELWREVKRGLQKNKEQGKGIKSAKHLANLQLDDPELEIFLANLLKKVQTPESLSYDCLSKGTKPKKAVYYPNLIDYLSAQTASMKPYRLWLAKPPLLLAIFQDQNVVEDIILERDRLYKELKAAGEDDRKRMRPDIKLNLEYLFKSRIPSNYPDRIINFEASLTKPKRN